MGGDRPGPADDHRSAAARNAAAIRERAGAAPRVAVVLGSGLGALTRLVEDPIRFAYGDLAGFPATGVSGHSGEVILGRIGAGEVAVLSGRAHFYEHGRADVMRPVLETLAALGVETVILTNAAGGLRDDLAPGTPMLIADHINFGNANPLIGEGGDARFVDMSQAYDRALASAAQEAAAAERIALPSGVYGWFSGPSFETPAEIRAARLFGIDAVGMSTVPEVILARFLKLRVLALSVITNFGAGLQPGAISHEQTKVAAPEGGAKLVRILARLLAQPLPGPLPAA